MERLSNSPYAIRRFNPSTAGDFLPFAVPDALARAITNNHTLSDLYTTGRLFYANYTSVAGRDPNRVDSRALHGCVRRVFLY